MCSVRTGTVFEETRLRVWSRLQLTREMEITHNLFVLHRIRDASVSMVRSSLAPSRPIRFTSAGEHVVTPFEGWAARRPRAAHPTKCPFGTVQRGGEPRFRPCMANCKMREHFSDSA